MRNETTQKLFIALNLGYCLLKQNQIGCFVWKVFSKLGQIWHGALCTRHADSSRLSIAKHDHCQPHHSSTYHRVSPIHSILLKPPFKHGIMGCSVCVSYCHFRGSAAIQSAGNLWHDWPTAHNKICDETKYFNVFTAASPSFPMTPQYSQLPVFEAT